MKRHELDRALDLVSKAKRVEEMVCDIVSAFDDSAETQAVEMQFADLQDVLRSLLERENDLVHSFYGQKETF